MPVHDLSTDELTMGFKGKHVDKIRITYKKEGYGFQCYCISDHGYTFTFYFRNSLHLRSVSTRCTLLYIFAAWPFLTAS